jgi:Tfp pilus assembly protein PilV
MGAARLITVRRRSRGFTLIEILVAFVILMISMLAILNCLVVTVEHNLRNLMRDEALRLAEAKMEELRGTPLASLSSGTAQVQRSLRNLLIPFDLSWRISDYSTKTKRLELQVRLTYRGITHSYTVTSLLSEGS